MKKRSLFLLANFVLLTAFAQTSKFNPRELFALDFYPQGGNEYRSANGSPGPKYWQNGASYKIGVTLDTLQHKVYGDVEITYTNNSPDALNYLWLQLITGSRQARHQEVCVPVLRYRRTRAHPHHSGLIIRPVPQPFQRFWLNKDSARTACLHWADDETFRLLV